MNKEEIMVSLKKYIVFFYIYAFLGWIIDVSIVFVSDGHLTNRGFLYETICPMYGFEALVLITLSKKFKGKGRIFKKSINCNIMVFSIRICNSSNIRCIFPSKMVGLLKSAI